MIRYKPVFKPCHPGSGGSTFNPIPSRPYVPERADGEIEWVVVATEDNAPSPRARAFFWKKRGGNTLDRSRT